MTLSLPDSIYRRFQGKDFTGTVWNDSGIYSQNITDISNVSGVLKKTYSVIGNGVNKKFQVVDGMNTDNMQILDTSLNVYTLFTVARYKDLSGGRIFDTNGAENWLSGFRNTKGYAGVAVHGDGPPYLTGGDTTNVSPVTNWVLSTDYAYNYRCNGVSKVMYPFNGITYLPALSVNRNTLRIYSNFQIADIIIYNRKLTLEQIVQAESYLFDLYGFNGYYSNNVNLYSLFMPITKLYNNYNIVQSVSGLQLWLDANDYSTLDLINLSLQQWNDKSGYGRNATKYGTALTNATYVSNGLNNLPSIHINDRQGLYAYMPCGTTNTGVTVFVVYKNDETGIKSPFEIISRGHFNFPGPFDIYDTTRYVGDSSGIDMGTSSYNLRTATSPIVFSFTAKKDEWKEYVNGISKFDSSFCNKYGDTTNYIYIGIRADKNTDLTTFNGYMSEIILYNRILTTDERQKIELYLISKWNITSATATIQNGLQLWLDANDYSTLTLDLTNSSLQKWNDKSGYGRNAIKYGTANATYVINGLNNMPSINITEGQGLYAKIPSGTTNSNITVFIVFNSLGTPGKLSGLISRGTTSLPGPFDMYDNTRISGNTSGYKTFSSTFNLNNTLKPILLSFSISNGSWKEYINGNLQFDSSFADIYSDTTDYIYIGTRADNTTVFNGFISEIMVYNIYIDTNDRQNIEKYLKLKWNIPHYKSTNYSINGNDLSALFQPNVSSTNQTVNYKTNMVDLSNQFQNINTSIFTILSSTVESVTSKSLYLKLNGTNINNINTAKSIINSLSCNTSVVSIDTSVVVLNITLPSSISYNTQYSAFIYLYDSNFYEYTYTKLFYTAPLKNDISYNFTSNSVTLYPTTNATYNSINYVNITATTTTTIITNGISKTTFSGLSSNTLYNILLNFYNVDKSGMDSSSVTFTTQQELTAGTLSLSSGTRTSTSFSVSTTGGLYSSVSYSISPSSSGESINASGNATGLSPNTSYTVTATYSNSDHTATATSNITVVTSPTAIILTIEIGKTKTYFSLINNNIMPNTSISYSISPLSSGVSISSSGVATGLSPNTSYTVTATVSSTFDSNATATSSINVVTAPASGTLSLSSGTKTSTSFSVSITGGLYSSVSYSISPSSSGESINASGNASGLLPNTSYTVTATYSNSDYTATAKSIVTVVTSPTAGTLSLSSGTKTLTSFSVSTTGGIYTSVSYIISPSSSGESINSSGNATGLSPNNAYTVTATYSNSDNTSTATSNVTSLAPAPTIRITSTVSLYGDYIFIKYYDGNLTHIRAFDNNVELIVHDVAYANDTIYVPYTHDEDNFTIITPTQVYITGRYESETGKPNSETGTSNIIQFV